MKSDRSIYAPLPIPVSKVGESFIDPVFGTTVKRITDCSQIEDVSYGDGRKCWSCQVEYASVTPFNSDSTRLLLMHGSSGFAVYDGTGQFLFYPTVAGRYEVTPSSEPRWSASDPDFFYYLSGNELKLYDVVQRRAKLVRRFDEYIVRTVDGVNGVRGLGEGDINGRFWALMGQYLDGAVEVFVFNLDAGTKSNTLHFLQQSFNNLQTTTNGSVIVAFEQPGKSPAQGEILYHPDMRSFRPLSRAAGHQDIGKDENGEECLIWVDSADPEGPTCSPASGIVKVLLKDGSKTCVLPLNWEMAAHVYCPQIQGKALVSTYSANANPTPAPYLNEIMIVSTDGKDVQRLCHHRSVPYSGQHQPHATGNRDLTKIVFNSCMARPNDPNYTDVYMIDLAEKPPEKPVETPSPVQTPDSLWGYSKIDFTGSEGKEWLLRLKVVNGQLIAEMYDKAG